MAAETEENRYKEVLDQLVAKQWTVYRVSPLWNVPWKESARNMVMNTNLVLNIVLIHYIFREHHKEMMET